MDAYRFAFWDGIPVYENPRLSLNVVSRLEGRIEMAFTTWLQLKENPTMLKHAQWCAGQVGVHSIPAMMHIPGGKVGDLWKQSQTVLAMAAEGMGEYAERTARLRAEIAEMQAVLAQATAALDLADQVAEINSATV